jgi:hypothetical protein
LLGGNFAIVTVLGTDVCAILARLWGA